MNQYIKLLRPSIGLLAMFAVIVGSLVSGFTDPYSIAIACLAAFLISSGGNVLNDYFDYKIDKINRPDRPISSGKVKLKTALIYSIVLFVIGNSLVFLLNYYMLALALFNTFFIIIYDKYLKKMVIGNLAESWLGGSSFIFGALLTKAISFPILILFTIGYFANTGREITKSIEDIKGDKKLGLKTFSIYFGEKISKITVVLSILAALALTPLPYFYGFVNIYYLILVVICDIAFLYSLYILFKDISKAQKIMKIALYIGIFAFLAGIL